MRPISTIYCCSFCFKVQFRIARVQRCTVCKLHCTLLRRHVKVQHTFTVARVQVEWRLVSLQNTAVDCIRQFGNCNYVALLKQEYMWSGYVSKERKRVLLTPIFANQPAWEDLGAQDVMGLPGQSLLLQFSGNIFFRKLSLEIFIVWFIGQYMPPIKGIFNLTVISSLVAFVAKKLTNA